jgi:hypothetical protein
VTQADVALTDFALALECACFAVWVRTRSSRGSVSCWLQALFGASAAAPLAGGLYHGFFADPASLAGRVLWPTALFVVGCASLACWALAAHLVLAPRAARVAVRIAALQLAVYGMLLLAGWQNFSGAVAVYVPATLALLAASLRRSAIAAAGLGVTLAAAAAQQSQLSLPALQLSHNALYHLIQAIGFALFFSGSRHWGTVSSSSNGEVSCSRAEN